MTEDDKLNELVEFLTEAHLGVSGGYPYDHVWIGDVLVVAGLDDGKERQRTTIDTFERSALIEWFDRAAEFVKAHPDFGDDPAGAFHETWPVAQ